MDEQLLSIANFATIITKSCKIYAFQTLTIQKVTYSAVYLIGYTPKVVQVGLFGKNRHHHHVICERETRLDLGLERAENLDGVSSGVQCKAQ